jgi:hypothetical protein
VRPIIYALCLVVLALSISVGFEFHSLNAQRSNSRNQTCDSIKAVDDGLISIVTPSKKQRDSYTPEQRKRSDDFVALAKKTFVPPAYC